MATVTYRLNRPKKNGELKTTPVPILVSYYHNGIEVADLSTGQKTIPAKWTGSRIKGEAAILINKHLNEMEKDLLNAHLVYKHASKQELEQIIRKIIKGELTQETEPYQKKTSLFTVWRFIAQYAREKDPGTVKRYKVLARALKRFLKGERLDFKELDFNFYDAFKNYLYATPNPHYRGYQLEYSATDQCYDVVAGDGSGQSIGLFDEVVFKYFVNLKTVCAWAEKRGYPVHPAYKSWDIIKREHTPITLTKEELEAIEGVTFTRDNVTSEEECQKLRDFWIQKNYSLESIAKRIEDMIQHRIKSYDIARDYISLESRTGQRISDLRRFKREDLLDGVWTFFQKKGNRIKAKLIELPLDGFAAPALVILQKYRYELPKISEQKLNENIKEACKIAGIGNTIHIERWAGNKKIRITGPKYEFVSTHTGKKSFITILASEGVPVSILSILTGTSQRTIERHYLGRMQVSKVREYLKKADPETVKMKVG